MKSGHVNLAPDQHHSHCKEGFLGRQEPGPCLALRFSCLPAAKLWFAAIISLDSFSSDPQTRFRWIRGPRATLLLLADFFAKLATAPDHAFLPLTSACTETMVRLTMNT